jgi:hypothetical protein
MTLMKSMASLHQGPNFFVIIYLRLGTASLNLNCSNATNSDSSKLPMTANTNLIFHPFFFLQLESTILCMDRVIKNIYQKKKTDLPTSLLNLTEYFSADI